MELIRRFSKKKKHGLKNRDYFRIEPSGLSQRWMNARLKDAFVTSKTSCKRRTMSEKSAQTKRACVTGKKIC